MTSDLQFEILLRLKCGKGTGRERVGLMGWWGAQLFSAQMQEGGNGDLSGGPEVDTGGWSQEISGR